MAEIQYGKRNTDGVTVTNGMRLLASFSGIIALIVVLWAVPDWVRATDDRMAHCEEQLSDLNKRAETIQELKVDVEVTKAKVGNIAKDVDEVKTTITNIARKQDEVIQMLLESKD